MLKKAVTAAALVSLILGLSVVSAQGSVNFCLYGSSSCPACVQLKKFLTEEFGSDVLRFNEVYGNETNAEKLARIYDLAFPNLPAHERYIPVTGVFCNGRLVAVVVGVPELDESFWRELASRRDGILLVLHNGTTIQSEDPQLISSLEEIFGGASSPTGPATRTAAEVLIPVTTAALADSVNPCTFSVFTALLLLSMSAGGKRRSLSVGGAFIAAVFMAYYALGLGLIRVFSTIPWLKYAVAILGLVVGSYEVITSLGGSFKSPLPDPLYRTTSRLVEWTSHAASVPLAFCAGLLISVTLLPCSSGPYLVATSLLAGLPGYQRLALLGMYNTIFVTPLVLILLVVGLLERRVRDVKVWRSKKLHVLNLVAGSLLIVICLWALLAP
ncbi:MAG: hypothetical protein QI223_03395 [Candidatus Korarchaeota archaeon]|nr:hypothetical protein [Candidatus Korarchaeota archaeon]